MTDKPILFSAPMVRALLDGRKTQTRRVAKFIEPIPERGTYHIRNSGGGLVGVSENDVASSAPDYAPHQPGDRLWVREAWSPHQTGDCGNVVVYKATNNYAYTKWKPSIHMPRWASRVTLVVTAVRVQRLQEISKDDVIAEGIHERAGLPIKDCHAGWHEPFADLWKSLNGPGSWDANPWVAAYTFTVHKCNIDDMGAAND